MTEEDEERVDLIRNDPNAVFRLDETAARFAQGHAMNVLTVLSSTKLPLKITSVNFEL